MKTTADSPPFRKYAARTLNEHRYAETFAAFLSRSTEYPAMVDELKQVCRRSPSETFSCLDIGAGTGTVIEQWLESCQKDGSTRYPSQYVAVEPNPDHVQSLQATLQRLSSVQSRVLAQPFSVDFELDQESNKFDMVLFSHSLYCIRNPQDCIRHAWNFVKPNGVILIFLQGPFGFYTMHHLFEPLLERDNPSVVAFHGISSHEIVQEFRNMGLHPTVQADPAVLDLTGLFDTNDTSKLKLLEEILSFILQVEMSRIEEPLKQDIVQTLQDSCCNIQGRLCLHHPNMAIQVTRP